jgi:hypothetical protein
MTLTREELDDVAHADATRCVAVIDAALPRGKAANAAAVLALTMGRLQPQLAGEDFTDAASMHHPGLIPIGIPVLGAPAADLPGLREKALSAGLHVVDFPAQGQQTNDYAMFRRMVGDTAPDELRYLGVMIYGDRKKVGRIVGRYRLLGDQGTVAAPVSPTSPSPT